MHRVGNRLCALALFMFSLMVVAVPPASAAVAPALALTPLIRGASAQVQAPAGVTQVVLELRQGKGWKPLAVRHLQATASSAARRLAFALPAGLTAADLRVFAYRGAKFPARTARAARRFQRTSVGAAATGAAVHVLDALAPAASRVLADNSAEDPVAVTSDIWKIVGNQLFFFNQYRGLQVLDMTDPAAPVRTGTLRLAASGEQFYALNSDGSSLALLGRSNSQARPGAASLFLLRVSAGVPTLVTEVPLTGAVTDSRLIGNRLYVLSNDYLQRDGVWTPEAVLQAVDLANPAAPLTLPALHLPGNSTALQAAAGYLLVGTDQWQDGAEQARLHLIDLAQANGAPLLRKSFVLTGPVVDKFKIGIVKAAVVATTLDWSQGRQETWVETFPVTGMDTAPLARMELVAARGEQLHATRYDGERLYVVTFRNTDPLFVVDLSDPAAPLLAGTLEIPGWSSYIEPLGERLLAVGMESGRVTVSLFDVADAAAPTLLSRLPLGTAGTWSWSEANADEKAVEYFPDAGIVLVPFQNYTTEGELKAVAAIRVGQDTLTADVLIQHAFNPRRGAVMGDYFVSISGQELLVLDRTRNTTGQPEVQVSLAWTTDRVISLGDYLVQVEDGGGNDWASPLVRMAIDSAGGGGTHSVLRVSSAADPDELLGELDLGAGRVVGLTNRNGRLFAAQWVTATTDTPVQLRTWVWDLAGAPDLTQVTTLVQPVTGLAESDLDLAAGQLLWTGLDTLVWHAPARQAWGGWWGGPVMMAAPALAVVGSGTAAIKATAPPQTLAGVLCPIRGTDGNPTAGPLVRVQTAGAFRSASRALAENGFLFFGFDTATALAAKTPATAATTGGQRVGLMAPWWQPQPETLHSWLQVVDLRASEAVVRDQVSIPGALLSVTQVDAQGAVLITDSERVVKGSGFIGRTLEASAYDGVDAYLLDRFATTARYGGADAADGTAVFLADAASPLGVIAIGYVPQTGLLARVGRWNTAPPDTLRAVNGYLLAATSGGLSLARIGAAGQLTGLGTIQTPTNLSLRLDAAVITPNEGIWVPAGEYGVQFLPWVDLTRPATARR